MAKQQPSGKKVERVYHPPKTFDDDLASLVRLYKDKKWSFSNVDAKQLEKDVKDQRDARTAYTAAERAWEKQSHDFAVAQAARHARFSSALGTAREAFKHDASVQKELGPFKRSVKRGGGGGKKKTGGATSGP